MNHVEKVFVCLRKFENSLDLIVALQRCGSFNVSLPFESEFEGIDGQVLWGRIGVIDVKGVIYY